MIKIKEVVVKDYVTDSKLPDSDYVINPYTGCTHACKYCYACYMRRFSLHTEPWGEFVDIKRAPRPISVTRLENKRIVIGSVTDPYQPIEKQCEVTREILKQLIQADCEITICTKSDLVLRDVDLLKQMKNVKVSVSVNTTDEDFRHQMDNASPIHARMDALKQLHDNNIETVCFISPIFPEITDWENIVLATRDFVDEYWFENLNLRDEYKSVILEYIREQHPELLALYTEIYQNKDILYWEQLETVIAEFCNSHKLKFKNYFYHEKIRKNTK